MTGVLKRSLDVVRCIYLHHGLVRGYNGHGAVLAQGDDYGVVRTGLGRCWENPFSASCFVYRNGGMGVFGIGALFEIDTGYAGHQLRMGYGGGDGQGYF